jgi:hypothetical protein
MPGISKWVNRKHPVYSTQKPITEAACIHKAINEDEKAIFFSYLTLFFNYLQKLLLAIILHNTLMIGDD